MQVESLAKLAVSVSEPCSSSSGADTCSSPAPRPVVNRTFEGIVLSPEASLSPDTTSNSRPLTRKRRAEISPVIDQPGALHMQACLSYLAPLDASPCCAWSACLVWSLQPDDAGTGAVVQLKSSKLAHSQLRGFTQPVSKTFGPHDTLAGAASKNTPAAVDDDCTEWWAAYSGCSLDSSAVLQAALTPNAAADCGKCLTQRLPECTSCLRPCASTTKCLGCSPASLATSSRCIACSC